MAHVTKIKRGGVYNSLAHDNRSQEHISNPDINHELTDRNLAITTGDSWENYKSVMDSEEVHCCKRADVNTLCSWIVTSPLKLDEAPEEVHEKLFMACHGFMVKRYGVELENGDSNIISSMIHYDETMPHLHFKFIPLVPDLKKGGYKVNAKEVINKADLQSFHQDLQAYLDEQGIGLSIVKDVTVDKDYKKSIADLKKETKVMEQEKRSMLTLLDAEIASKKAQIEEMANSIAEAVTRRESAEIDAEIAENRLGKLKEHLHNLELDLKETNMAVMALDDLLVDANNVVRDYVALEPKVKHLSADIQAQYATMGNSLGITARTLQGKNEGVKRKYADVLKEVEVSKAKAMATAVPKNNVLPKKKNEWGAL